MSLQPTIDIPLGIALPSDADEARELIALAIEEAEAEQRALELLENISAERVLTFDV